MTNEQHIVNQLTKAINEIDKKNAILLEVHVNGKVAVIDATGDAVTVYDPRLSVVVMVELMKSLELKRDELRDKIKNQE